MLLASETTAQSEADVARLLGKSQPARHDFSEIDNYVLSLKTGRNASEKEIVELITKKSTTKLEKGRAIFVWIADNIAYDTSYKITSPEEGLRKRKGVCQAYSDLFQRFGEAAGLEVVTISGDSKQFYYKKPSDLDRGGHAWNAFKSDDGKWIFLDATWGAGYVQNRKFTKQLTDYWFNPAPAVYVFTHFPEDKQWQLLDKPIGRDDFLKIPPVSPKFINWGFDADALLSFFLSNKHSGFPDFYTINVDWKVIKMPVSAELKRGTTYEFVFEMSETEEVVIFLNNDHFTAEKSGNRHTIKFTPDKKGTVMVTVKQKNGEYAGVLRYVVK
jgi:transglutaminase-like putative cysteine protease